MAEHECRDSLDAEPTRVDSQQADSTLQSELDLQHPSVLEWDGESPLRRYLLGAVLGKGGTSRVYQAFDRDLSRTIAVKCFNDSSNAVHGRFVEEVRITANLEHPNIVPIYDLGISNDGHKYVTMRRVGGESLGQLIRQAIRGQQSEPMPLNALVTVFLKVCDAVAYAHAKGVVHQDIKPDNIMLGNHGEVLVIDWGAASSSSRDGSKQSLMGTPQYMSPEQVRGEVTHPGIDVYGIGASLFYALLFRHPLVSVGGQAFWEKKARGEVDAPTDAERARVPRALLSIVERAMHPDASQRYPSIQALAVDLESFQSGKSIWGLPVLEETFEDESFKDRWFEGARAGFVVDSGRLVSKGPSGSVLLYRRRLDPHVAIEFDGEVLSGCRPGDLSVIWTEEDVAAMSGSELDDLPCARIQVGAFDNQAAAIVLEGHPSGLRRPHQLEAGRSYRIRAEIDGTRMRLLVDDQLLLERRASFPRGPGYLGLYGYYPGKAFSNLRIFSKGLPAKVNASAIGDAFFVDKQYSRAASHYTRVRNSHVDADMVQECCYKEGLCYYRLADYAAAIRVWQDVRDPFYRGLIEVHWAQRHFAEERYEPAAHALEGAWQRFSEVRHEVAAVWNEQVLDVCRSRPLQVGPFLQARDRSFPDDLNTSAVAATGLLKQGKWQEVVLRFPEELEVETALIEMGQEEEALRRASRPSSRNQALLAMGRFHEMTSPFLQDQAWLAQAQFAKASPGTPVALLATGQSQAVLASPKANDNERASALRQEGRIEEAAALGDCAALLELGRVDEVLVSDFAHNRLRGQLARVLEAARHADLDGYEVASQAAEELPWSALWDDIWFQRFVMKPLCHWLLRGKVGLPERLRRSLDDATSNYRYAFRQKLWYGARFISGVCSEAEFHEQPVKFGLAPRAHLCAAVRAELAGEDIAAVRRYRTYLDLPFHERYFDWIHGNPVLDQFADWRVRSLAQP